MSQTAPTQPPPAFEPEIGLLVEAREILQGGAKRQVTPSLAAQIACVAAGLPPESIDHVAIDLAARLRGGAHV